MNLFNTSSPTGNFQLPGPDQALPGRTETVTVTNHHFVKGTQLMAPFPDKFQQAYFAMGCFWGAERKFWNLEGVFTTAVGYTAGFTPNPGYEEVCSGMTGHCEVVLVVYDPEKITYEQLLKVFWESHNPSQGMRQGNDQGTQYRSGIYTTDEQQLKTAGSSKERYQSQLLDQGFELITTEIMGLNDFYYAEDYHQQYLAKNPNGYCGLSSAQDSGRPLFSC